MKQLYLYFVNELVVSGDEKPVLTTVAAVAVGSGYDKDNEIAASHCAGNSNIYFLESRYKRR